MKNQIMKLGIVAMVAAGAVGFPLLSDGALVHRWSFNDGTANDSVGTAHGTLFGNTLPAITGGKLVLNPGSDQNQYMKTSAFTGETLSNRTLVGWVTLSNINQPGASGVLGIHPAGVDNFDSIVYGERVAKQWMNGSSGWARTVANNGGAAETSTDEVMMAIVYDSDNSIKLYRNGVRYDTGANAGTLVTRTDPIAVLGRRQQAAAEDLQGAINEARIYNTALTASEIAALYAQGPDLELKVTVTAPANGQQFLSGSSVTGTVTVAGGTAPYTVTYYTNSAPAWSTNNASTNLFTIPLGALAAGTYTNYAEVTDNVASNATSTTNIFTVLLDDTTAPTPNPMTFAVAPWAMDNTTMIMTATTATDALTPPVQYYFENVSNLVNSGWVSSTVWTNTGLTQGAVYGYRVKARDSATTLNETTNSAVFNALAESVETLTWDANTGTSGAQDGTGDWLAANQWWNGVGNPSWLNAKPNSAVIGAGGAGGTITLGNVIAGSVTFTNFTGTYTLTGGSLTNSGGITVAANAGSVTISTPVSGSGGMVKNGASTLTLSSTNNYTGGTVINAGTVLPTTAASIGSGPIAVNTGGTLSLVNVVLNNNLTLNGGTLQQYINTFSGPITLSTNSIIYADGSNFQISTIGGAISGAGRLTQNGPGRAGVTLLTGTNTYTGATVINNGALVVKSSLYSNDTSKWTPSNITVAANAVLGMSVGGGGEFTMAQVATMFTNLTTNVNNNGMRPGSFMSVDTRNAPAGTYTFSGVLADSTGTGGGAVNFFFYGTASTTLELTGANTYSGVTMIENNGTLKVSSFNSVSNNPGLGTVHSASSSLGAPTTVFNGTILLGCNNWNGNQHPGTTYASGNLTYTGTGETTDRVLALGGYSGTKNYTLNHSGTGLLKFTSNIATPIGNTVNNLILTGSTAGTGEFAGVIPNNNVGYNTTLNKNGAGTWTLSATNVYEGSTLINGGTLVISGSISTGAVTVAMGGTLGGTGVVNGVVTLAVGDANNLGGSLNIRDGVVNTINLTSGLIGSGTAANPNNLYFDLGGSAGVSDTIVVTGTNSAPIANSVLVHFRNQLTAGPPAGTNTLIQCSSAGNDFTGYAPAVTNAGHNTYSITTNGNNLQVVVAPGNSGDIVSFLYWKGSTPVWSTAQWYSDSGGTVTANPPGYRSNVRFAAAGAGSLANALGQDYEINSLTVDSGMGATIISNNTLTIDATADNNNPLGKGLSVSNAAGTTIASKVGVAGSQTWTVGSSATVTVTGVIDNFDNGSTIAKAGAGTLYLKGLNVFRGQLSVEDGVLKVDSINNILTRGPLGMSTSPVVLGKTGGSTGTLEYAGNTNISSTMPFILATGGFGVFQVDNASATQTMSGVISGGGSLTKTGDGTLLLSGFNTYTGNTTVVAGKVIIAQACLYTNMVMYLPDTNSLILNYTGSNQIGTLYVNGVRQLGGPSSGTIGTNYYFGAGSIYLPPDPPPGGMVFIFF